MVCTTIANLVPSVHFFPLHVVDSRTLQVCDLKSHVYSKMKEGTFYLMILITWSRGWLLGRPSLVDSAGIILKPNALIIMLDLFVSMSCSFH